MFTLRLDLIEEIAKSEKEQLTNDALRTIRQRNPEKGMAMLNHIEGIERFVQSLKSACNSAYYRQVGQVQEVSERPPVQAKVRSIQRRDGRFAIAHRKDR